MFPFEPLPLMTRRPYPSDLDDQQWALIQPYLPPPAKTGRPRTNLREVLNAIFYVLRTSCAWRSLPHDFPAWQTVYEHFNRWSKDGTLERMHDALRTRARKALDREANPTALIVDSQTVKAPSKGGLEAMIVRRR